MATQAGKPAAVARGAGRFVRHHFRRAVVREEVFHMVGGLQNHRLRVASSATIGRVDLVVADQAVGHLGQVVVRNGFVLENAAVAGDAGVLVVLEVGTDIGSGLDRQVGILIDGGGEQL